MTDTLPPLPERPLVSIIVPSYNQGRFIGETLESILSQEYRPIEVLVIDGASTDETVDVLKSFDTAAELRWWSEPDSGVVEAVNKGFDRAKGLVGGIQSSDDAYLPGAIAAGVRALCEDASLGFCYGDIMKVDADGAELSRTDLAPFSLEAMLSFGTWVPQPSTFFRMALATELGGWREAVPYAADTDLWLRMALRSGARKLDEMMALRRMHGEQRDVHGDRIVRDFRAMVDSIEALSDAPPSVRGAAVAGKALIANRYARDGYWAGFFRLWRAVLACRSVRARTPLGALVPGWAPLRRLATRLRRGEGA